MREREASQFFFHRARSRASRSRTAQAPIVQAIRSYSTDSRQNIVLPPLRWCYTQEFFAPQSCAKS